MRNECKSHLLTFYAELVFEQGPKDLKGRLDVGSISGGKIRILFMHTNTNTSQSTHIKFGIPLYLLENRRDCSITAEDEGVRTNYVEDLDHLGKFQ